MEARDNDDEVRHESQRRLEEEDEDPVSEEEEEDEDEDEDDEDEDEEPKLKYQRLGSSVLEIVQKDSCSCMAVHDRYLVLGTSLGIVYVLDFNGNEIKRFPSHRKAVRELSIEASGEFIASCSDDGNVVINGLYGGDTATFAFQKPLLSVCLDPQYAKSKSKSFVVGGVAGQLIMQTKGWFSKSNRILHGGEGSVRSIRWRSSLIAWANDIGVKIFDCETQQRITYIDRPKGSPAPDKYTGHIAWESDTTILIGWADSIKIGHVKQRVGRNAQGLPSRYVEIVALFQTDYFISGIAPFGEYLVVLAYLEQQQAGKAERPELRIIARSGEEISSDALTIHGYESHQATDYRIDFSTTDTLFFIVSPKDVVMGKPRDLEDHISWLMARERYEEAMEAAEAHQSQLKDTNVLEIGERFLNHLLGENKIDQAALLTPKVLRRDPNRWKIWVHRFAKLGHLKAIVSVIPVGNPRLDDLVYEMVLNYFLMNDHETFSNVLSEWPSDLYKVPNVIAAILAKLKECPDSVHLMDALAQAYTYNKQFDKTLRIFLRLQRGNVYELIDNFSLFGSVKDKVLQLMKFNVDKTVNLLVKHVDELQPQQVMGQLESHREYQHAYLSALFKKDTQVAADFHQLQVHLYADFDYPLLLPFLRTSNYYRFEEAFAECEKRRLFPEMVFLLSRMGNAKQALRLIMEKLEDVREAIEFVQSQGDDELWEDLISFSMRNPRFISGLLENIGANVDPIMLISRIPLGMDIDGLRDRLVHIINDFNLQTSLREGCNRILQADCIDLMNRQNRLQRRARFVDASKDLCALCNAEVAGRGAVGGAIVVFFCDHIFHRRCVLGSTKQLPVSSPSSPSAPPSLPLSSPSTPTTTSGDPDEKLSCPICRKHLAI